MENLEQKVNDLTIQLRALEVRNVELGMEIQTLNAHNRDLQHAEEILRELPPEVVSAAVPQRLQTRMKQQDPKRLEAQIQLLRKQVRQELAVNEYLAENQKEGTLDFNKLPIETRKSYFDKVDAKL